MSARAAGIATRSRPAPCLPTPSAPAGAASTRPSRRPTSSSTTSPHMFGTKRTGPDLSRVGGKYDTQWHRTHFRNPRDLVPGSVMPPFPWIVEQPGGVQRAGGLHPDPGPRQGLAAGQRLREVGGRSHGLHLSERLLRLPVLCPVLLLGASSSSCSRMQDGYWGKDGEEIKYQVFADEDSEGRHS